MSEPSPEEILAEIEAAETDEERRAIEVRAMRPTDNRPREGDPDS